MAFQINLVSIPGNATLNLADGVNYSIDDEEGTFTAFMIPPEAGISSITETITVNVLGGTSSNPAIRRKVAADNLNALTAMLRQVQAHRRSQAGWVNLEIVPPQSSPPRKYTAALLNWLPDVYLPDVTAAENLPSGVFNRITITYTRRAPWDWTWLNENEVTGTANMSSITSVQNGLTRSDLGGSMAWGGVGYAQFTKTGALGANMYLNLGLSCITGIPVTFSIGVSHTNITSLDVQLVSLGPPTGRSNVVVATMSAYTDLITNGQRFAATLTPTFTGTLYPYFQIGGPIGATLRLTEPMFQNGTVAADDTAWHVSQAVEMRPASAIAASFVPANPVFAQTENTISPTAMTITFPSAYQPTSGLVKICNASVFTGGSIGNLPSGASLATGFTSVAEAAGNRSMSNNVLRCTAAAAVTYVQPLGYTANGARCNLALALRNNAASNQWLVSIRVKPSVGSTVYFESRPISPVADNLIRMYPIGELAAPFNWGQIELVVTSNVAGGTIDFDWLSWDVIDENTCFMTHGGAPAAVTSLNIVPSTPRGYALINGGEIPALDDALFMTKASSLHVAYLGVTATTWSPPAGNIGYTLARYSAAEHVS